MDAFRYLLARTITGEVLDEVPFPEFSYTGGLNAPGGYTAKALPVTHRLAETLLADNACWGLSLYATRGNLVYFGGPITSPAADTDSDEVTVGGLGVLGYYRDGRRNVRSRLGMTYAQADAAGDVSWLAKRTDLIAVDLFNHAAFATGGVLPLTLDVIAPTRFPTATVNLNSYERKGIGDQLDAIAAIAPGFSYWTTHYFDAGDSPPTVATVLHLAPNNGPLRTVATVLELGRNAQVAGLTIDGGDQANVIDGTGQGQGDAMLLESVEDASAMYPNVDTPRLERVLNLTDVRDATALRAAVTTELALRRRPTRALKLTIVEDVDSQLGTFGPGDDVLVAGSYGAIDLNGRWRLLTLGVGIDADGNVTIEVDAVPSSSFTPL